MPEPAAVVIASSASALTMDWTFIGDAGNPADTEVMNDATTGYGSVPYDYYIGTYDVTNAQYSEFLNAVGRTDANGLYDASMADSFRPNHGGIARTGVAGSYTYNAIAGRENMPVNHVSFYDALRFVNWLNNGQPVGAQGAGTTEDGAYRITVQGIADNSIARNPQATIVLPSENEWYKAAYYAASAGAYYTYPSGDSAFMLCRAPTAASDSANCNADDLTIAGSFTGSTSDYGTYDQGGNVWEWNEAVNAGTQRGARGSSFQFAALGARSSYRAAASPENASADRGFRVAMVPEPGTCLLVIAGLLGHGGWRRARA